MGDLYKHHRVVFASCGRFFSSLTAHVLWRYKNVSTDVRVAGIAPRAGERALVLRFCVQLVLRREATTPSSPNK